MCLLLQFIEALDTKISDLLPGNNNQPQLIPKNVHRIQTIESFVA